MARRDSLTVGILNRAGSWEIRTSIHVDGASSICSAVWDKCRFECETYVCDHMCRISTCRKMYLPVYKHIDAQIYACHTHGFFVDISVYADTFLSHVHMYMGVQKRERHSRKLAKSVSCLFSPSHCLAGFTRLVCTCPNAHVEETALQHVYSTCELW